MTGAPLLTLYPYQRRWVADHSRFKIGMMARQVGKTFATCLEIVDDVFQAAARGERTRWVILSRGERQAKEAMDSAIKPLARAYMALWTARGQALGLTERAVTQAVGALRVTVLEVEIAGSVISALPASPDTARGFSANVFLDEFAFHPDSRAIWGAVFPVVSRDGLRLRVVSTPNGKGNKFHELMTGSDSTWSRHRVTLDDAIADGLPRDAGALRAALGDETLWAQEYDLSWREEATSWLDWEAILAAEDPAAGDPAHYGGGPIYIGVDIARRVDLFVIWVVEQVGETLVTREIVEAKGITFAAQDALLDAVVARYRDVRRIAIDQTGMGEKPVEDASRRYGSHRVDGVLLSGARRQAVADLGRAAFLDRRIAIPAGHPTLRADLHKLKKSITATGRVQLTADRDAVGHADRTWACFLAIAATGNPTPAPAGVQLPPTPLPSHSALHSRQRERLWRGIGPTPRDRDRP